MSDSESDSDDDHNPMGDFAPSSPTFFAPSSPPAEDLLNDNDSSSDEDDDDLVKDFGGPSSSPSFMPPRSPPANELQDNTHNHNGDNSDSDDESNDEMGGFAPSSPPFMAPSSPPADEWNDNNDNNSNHDDNNGDEEMGGGYAPSSPPFMATSPEQEFAPSSPPPVADNDDDSEEHNFAPSSPPPSEEPPSSQPQPQQLWQVFQDDQGQTYYYNESTGESAWEKPEGFVEPQQEEQGGDTSAEPAAEAEAGSQTPPQGNDDDPWADQNDTAGADDDNHHTANETEDAFAKEEDAEGGGAVAEPPSDAVTATATAVGTNSDWQAFQDDEGRTYFYNEVTEVTQWDRPDSMPPTPEHEHGHEHDTTLAQGEGDGTEEPDFDGGYAESPTDMDHGMTGEDTAAAVKDNEEEQKKAEQEEAAAAAIAKKEEEEAMIVAVKVIDPVEQAQFALKETDAILELGTPSHIAELVKDLGPAKGYGTSLQSLTNGYHGLTSICGLLTRWTVDLSQTTHHAIPVGTAFPVAVAAAAASTPGSAASNNSSKGSSSASAAASNVRGIAERIIQSIVMEKFNKKGEDNIFTLSKKEIAFLDQMTDDPRWRKLLIDLSAKHKNSALLMFVLNQISSKGHHREIAGRINQSDYFEVYHQLLSSEIGIIGKSGVGSQQDLGQGGIHTLENIGKDLRKICTATGYTYLHARQLLDDLISRATQVAKEQKDKGKQKALERAVRKWERLSEDLEATLLSGSGGEGSTSMARKRQMVDMACVMSELHLAKRRRIAPSTATQLSPSLAKDTFRNAIDDSVLKLQKQHSMGTTVDILLVDKLLRLPTSTSTTTATNSTSSSIDSSVVANDDLILYVGEQLVAHPATIDALQFILFKPGSLVVKSPLLVKKCSAAMARATVAARRATYGSQEIHQKIIAQREEEANAAEGNNSDSEEEDGAAEGKTNKVDRVVTVQQEVDLVQAQVMEGSELCERVGNMVSFVVLDDANPSAAHASIGRRLSAICIQSAAVARGVVFWALELSKGPEFSVSAAYPTLTPCILSLVRIIAKHHPFVRHGVLQLAFLILGLPIPEDMSYQKAQALKEQCLRLLLWLSTQGQALDVLYRIAHFFRQGSTMLAFDSATVRYFIGGLLQVIVVEPKPSTTGSTSTSTLGSKSSTNVLSVSFVKCFATLLQTTPCKDAIQSAYFDLAYKKKTKLLVSKMVDMVHNNKEMTTTLSEKERKSILSLQGIYGNL
jgi:negative elongation factor C/D